MVGVGTQDSLGEAEEFVARHSITFPMLWEDGFASWQGFGIQRQPASVLVSAQGTELGRWQGALDDREHAEVLRLIGAA